MTVGTLAIKNNPLEFQELIKERKKTIFARLFIHVQDMLQVISH